MSQPTEKGGVYDPKFFSQVKSHSVVQEIVELPVINSDAIGDMIVAQNTYNSTTSIKEVIIDKVFTEKAFDDQKAKIGLPDIRQSFA